MKIECDKCAAKYSIADEKVRGKTFKIRCKKCSNVIIVRDKSAAVATNAGMSATAVAAAPAVLPGWHLAINGETVGPMPTADVRQRFERGEIDRDTAVWQEGFEDWVPLGDVAAFADLREKSNPSAAVASATRTNRDDPFASANQDDYTGSPPIYAAGVAARGVATATVEQRSTNVTLTGQRNENSVLFSLESLQAIASPRPTAAAAAAATVPAGGVTVVGSSSRGGAKGLATAAPSSEGSGLIDIRALGSMVHHGNPFAAAAPMGNALDDASLPSFGGAGLGGLTSTPLVPHGGSQPSAAAAVAVAPPRSNTVMMVLLVILILAVLGVAVALVTSERGAATTIQASTQRPLPSEAPSIARPVPPSASDRRTVEPDPPTVPSTDAKVGAGPSEDADPSAEAGATEQAEKADDGDRSPSRSGRTPIRRATRSTGESSDSKAAAPTAEDSLDGLPLLDKPSESPPKEASEPAPAPKPSSAKELDVDCILNPSSCKSTAGPATTKPAKAPPKKEPEANLPEKLTSEDIKEGVASVKDTAKACGAKHGAPPDTKVQVKLSISGQTGTVSSASAQPPHTGTPLGNCVAAALKKAKFKKFSKESIGAVYPVRM